MSYIECVILILRILIRKKLSMIKGNCTNADFEFNLLFLLGLRALQLPSIHSEAD